MHYICRSKYHMTEKKMSNTDFISYSFIFILGLVIGSFLNVCIYRIPRDESIVFPPSRCPKCGRKLSALENMPLLSYMLQRGKCKGCQGSISIRYPIVELLTGISFVWLFSMLGFSAVFLKYSVMMCILLAISFIDLEHKIIPDEIVVFSIGAGILLNLIARDVTFLSALIGFFSASGILLLMAVITKGAMGGGDIKLMAAMGIFIGNGPILLALFIGFMIGGFVSLILLIFKIKGRKDYIPFGPFLAAGVLVSGLFFDEILRWYLM